MLFNIFGILFNGFYFCYRLCMLLLILVGMWLKNVIVKILKCRFYYNWNILSYLLSYNLRHIFPYLSSDNLRNVQPYLIFYNRWNVVLNSFSDNLIN